MLLLITLIILSFVSILFWYHLKWNFEDKRLGIPGPSCFPILGNIISLWKAIQDKTLPFKIYELINEYGDTLRLRIGTKLFIFTRDVKIIEQIVNNPKFIKSDDYKIYEPWFGDGLVNAGGEKWHKMRKLLTPAFHFQILERFIPIYEEQGKVFLNKIRQFDEGTVIDVLPWCHAYALDVVSESSMRIKLNAQGDPNSTFIVANKILLNTMCLRFYYPLYQIDWIWKLTSHYKRVCELISYSHKFVIDVINERRTKLLFEMTEKEKLKEKPALLDILLQSTIDGKPLSNQAICDEINTFIVAGHESTGKVLSFISYVLAKYPAIQSQVYEEIKENGLCDLKRSLTIRDLSSLRFFDCVIKETLRMYPVLPCTLKQCAEDVKLGNFVLPANTVIVVCIQACHLNDHYFKNPEVFDPSRWSDELTSRDRNPYTFQPFSSGLRSCIGQRFALLEIRTLFIELLREYEIELASSDFEMDLKNGTLMYSDNGVQVKFKKRTNL